METAPSQSLYVKNLNDSLSKQDLRTNLYLLFSTYGAVLDVVALKTQKMRGQAHIVYKDIATASQAMRETDGMEFFGKPMTVRYAKTKSDMISKLEGTYVPSQRQSETNGMNGTSQNNKRPRDESDEEDE